jgi:hypothetical protein
MDRLLPPRRFLAVSSVLGSRGRNGMANEDVTNPGLVSVADQAYPAVLGVDSTAVPFNLDELLQASLFAPNPALGVPSTTGPTPTNVDVEDQANVPVKFGGTATPTPTEIDVNFQNLVGVDVDEFVVTDLEQNLQINETPETVVEFEILAVTVIPSVLPDPSYQLNTDPPLSPFGVPFSGREIEFSDGLNAGLVKTIQLYNPTNAVTIQGDGLAAVPMVGEHFFLDVNRRGSEVVARDVASTLNVFVSTAVPQPDPVGLFTSAPLRGFQGNVGAGSGVENAFIGTGVQLPPFVGSFDVADQNLTVGLPENVNVS